MQCISCGKKLTEEDKICPKCGKKQPLAETEKLTKYPHLKSLASIFLLIGITLLPFGILGLVGLIILSFIEKIIITKFILSLFAIIFITTLPFILAYIFNKIK